MTFRMLPCNVAVYIGARFRKGAILSIIKFATWQHWFWWCVRACASTALVFGFTTTLSKHFFLLSSNYQGLDLCVQSKKQASPLFFPPSLTGLLSASHSLTAPQPPLRQTSSDNTQARNEIFKKNASSSRMGRNRLSIWSMHARIRMHCVVC